MTTVDLSACELIAGSYDAALGLVASSLSNNLMFRIPSFVMDSATDYSVEIDYVSPASPQSLLLWSVLHGGAVQTDWDNSQNYTLASSTVPASATGTLTLSVGPTSSASWSSAVSHNELALAVYWGPGSSRITGIRYSVPGAGGGGGTVDTTIDVDMLTSANLTALEDAADAAGETPSEYARLAILDYLDTDTGGGGGGGGGGGTGGLQRGELDLSTATLDGPDYTAEGTISGTGSFAFSTIDLDPNRIYVIGLTVEALGAGGSLQVKSGSTVLYDSATDPNLDTLAVDTPTEFSVMLGPGITGGLSFVITDAQVWSVMWGGGIQLEPEPNPEVDIPVDTLPRHLALHVVAPAVPPHGTLVGGRPV